MYSEDSTNLLFKFDIENKLNYELMASPNYLNLESLLVSKSGVFCVCANADDGFRWGNHVSNYILSVMRNQAIDRGCCISLVHFVI